MASFNPTLLLHLGTLTPWPTYTNAKPRVTPDLWRGGLSWILSLPFHSLGTLRQPSCPSRLALNFILLF